MLPRRSSKPQADPLGYLQRTDRQLKQERLNKLIAGIRENRPFWASMAPWKAEPYIEGRAVTRTQASLFDKGAAR